MTQLEVWLAVLGLSFLGLLGWSAHERSVGEAAIRDADAKALAIAEQRAAAESAALQAQVNTAQAEASNAQETLDQFIATHPIGSVSVCHVTPGGPVSKTPGVPVATNGTGAGSGNVQPVPAVTSGPDISAGLTIIVRAAAELAIIDSEWQAAVAPKK